MGVISAAARELMIAGLEGEELCAALERIEAQNRAVDVQAERRREKDRDRKRLRNSAESAGTPAPPFPSPKPLTKTPLTPQPSANADGTGREHFEEFWKAYPRREGDNPKKPAKLAHSRALKRGIKPEALLAGAKALAAKHPTPTPFVPQAVTWINQDRCLDTESTGPPENIVRFRTVEEIFAEVDARNDERS